MSQKIELNVSGMSCQGCVRSVKAILGKSLGIERDGIDVALEEGKARFDFGGEAEVLETAIARLSEQGFESQKA